MNSAVVFLIGFGLGCVLPAVIATGILSLCAITDRIRERLHRGQSLAKSAVTAAPSDRRNTDGAVFYCPRPANAAPPGNLTVDECISRGECACDESAGMAGSHPHGQPMRTAHRPWVSPRSATTIHPLHR